MLGIHRVTSAGGDYYLADLAGELPLPPGAGGPPARWIGQAAEGLGLSGSVDEDQFRALLDGRHPTSGQRLRSGRASVLGFDLTFSAPKSVSVVFALGGDDAARHVLAAHRSGVRGAVAYVETHGLTAQRGSGDQREVVPTTGLLAASFTHGVSRNLDPHLHSHVVMSNLAHGTDGRWGACDWRGISAHRNAAAAVYEAHLRSELSNRLGVRWARGPGLRTEIEGVSPLLLGEFSSRSADIRMHKAEWRSRSARGARVAWAATRPPKVPGGTYEELACEWTRRAGSLGISSAHLAAHLDQGPPTSGMTFLDEHRFGCALSLSPDGAARRRDLVAAFGAAAVGGVDVETVEQLADLWAPATSDRAQVGVAEDVHSLRSVVPAPYLLRELGPRPVDPAGHEVWRDAARAIEGYRRRWGVAQRDALGVAALPSGISSLPTERLVEHLRISRDVEVARRRLGWQAPSRELDRGR